MSKKYVTISVALGILLILASVFWLSSTGKASEKQMPVSLEKQSVSADWTDHYMYGEDMVATSDLIIEGKVVNQVCEQRVDMIFTKQNLAVQKTYKGDLALGKQIQVLQTGGELNGLQTAPFVEAPLLENDSVYLLFLKFTDEGHYLILGGYQGVGEIENEPTAFAATEGQKTQPTEQKTLTEMAQELIDKHG